MNASELHELLEAFLTHPGIRNAGEWDVTIRTSERCLSCDGTVGIGQVVKGFDWHNGELIVVPQKQLVPKESHRDVPRKVFDGKCPECEETLRKGWRYCPNCGKAIEE